MKAKSEVEPYSGACRDVLLIIWAAMEAPSGRVDIRHKEFDVSVIWDTEPAS